MVDAFSYIESLLENCVLIRRKQSSGAGNRARFPHLRNCHTETESGPTFRRTSVGTPGRILAGNKELQTVIRGATINNQG